jgi:hypothetical protein
MDAKDWGPPCAEATQRGGFRYREVDRGPTNAHAQMRLASRSNRVAIKLLCQTKVWHFLASQLRQMLVRYSGCRGSIWPPPLRHVPTSWNGTIPQPGMRSQYNTH